MNKPIEETHPSLKYFNKMVGSHVKWFKSSYVQKHTIDKAVLNAYLDGYFLKDNAAVSELIRHVKNSFKLEEK